MAERKVRGRKRAGGNKIDASPSWRQEGSRKVSVASRNHLTQHKHFYFPLLTSKGIGGGMLSEDKQPSKDHCIQVHPNVFLGLKE